MVVLVEVVVVVVEVEVEVLIVLVLVLVPHIKPQKVSLWPNPKCNRRCVHKYLNTSGASRYRAT